MHTTEAHGVAFIHHGDYSGEVRIVAPDGQELEVPADALISFVAEFVRDKKMTQLEDASERELFGLQQDPP